MGFNSAFKGLISNVSYRLITFEILHVHIEEEHNRVLRKICRPKWDEETGEAEWRKLLTNELHDMFSAPNITRVMKSIRMTWPGQGMRHVWRG